MQINIVIITIILSTYQFFDAFIIKYQIFETSVQSRYVVKNKQCGIQNFIFSNKMPRTKYSLHCSASHPNTPHRGKLQCCSSQYAVPGGELQCFTSQHTPAGGNYSADLRLINKLKNIFELLFILLTRSIFIV